MFRKQQVFNPMPTIYDVAKHAGVSPMTVSYVLNKPERVGVETRERVNKSIQALNFYPNALARGLRGNTNTLGLVLAAGIAHPFSLGGWFALVLDSITVAANARDQNLLLLLERSQKDLIKDNADRLLDRRCGGMILMNIPRHSAIIPTLVKAKMPFVQVGDVADDNTTCIFVDDVAAARSGTEYLISKGHSRIVFAGFYAGFRWCDNRLKGYCQAMEDAGLHDKKQSIPWNLANGDFMPGLFESVMGQPTGERPTAILCNTDFTALVAMRHLSRMNLCVPEDVSIMGIDDIPEAATVDPGLTTIRQNFELLGSRVVDILLGRISGDVSLEYQEIIPTQLIVRHSVKSLPV